MIRALNILVLTKDMLKPEHKDLPNEQLSEFHYDINLDVKNSADIVVMHLPGQAEVFKIVRKPTDDEYDMCDPRGLAALMIESSSAIMNAAKAPRPTTMYQDAVVYGHQQEVLLNHGSAFNAVLNDIRDLQQDAPTKVYKLALLNVCDRLKSAMNISQKYINRLFLDKHEGDRP